MVLNEKIIQYLHYKMRHYQMVKQQVDQTHRLSRLQDSKATKWPSDQLVDDVVLCTEMDEYNAKYDITYHKSNKGKNKFIHKG